MKLILAIIRPDRLEAVQTELRKVLDEKDNYRLTVQSVEGHGAQQGEVEHFRGQEIRPRLIPKLQVTIGVNLPYVQPAVDAIIRGPAPAPSGWARSSSSPWMTAYGSERETAGRRRSERGLFTRCIGGTSMGGQDPRFLIRV